MRHATGGSPSGRSPSVCVSLACLFFFSYFFRARNDKAQVLLCGILSKCGKGSVGGRETGKKAKTTPDAGGKSVSEKSQDTRTCSNPFEKSESKQTEFFVREVKDERMTKNGPEFLIG